MPPTRPKSNFRKRPERKIKILKIKKGQQTSFFGEYFYQILGVLFVVITLFCKGLDYRWDESIVIALWIVGILFVARQTWRVITGEAAPAGNNKAKEKKPVVLAELVKKYKAPEVPRLSKDFSPEPPRGVKGYPPPSPFIKPPK